jgi:CRISPR-associated endonuclease/helicase Cas3
MGTSAAIPSARNKRIDATTNEDWQETHRLAVERSEDGDETRWIVIEQRRNQPESEEGRAITRFDQKLDDHQTAAERIARGFAEALNLSPDYSDMLAIAARLHDEGKTALRWQRAFNAPAGGIYAKTKGPINFKMLDGYRHEFGSLPRIEQDTDFEALPPNLQDLALHLVAAHHGGARPLISTRSCEDAPPSALEARAREVALRFARLQKRWGPWGLAWWESLLRAADQHASRSLDEREDGTGESPGTGEST